MKNRIGIVGGGQLGRMLTFAAKRLGFYVVILDPSKNSPAGQVADKQIVAHFTDVVAIKKLAKEVDFLTFEIELANAEILDKLSKQGVTINPSAKTLSIIKDKLLQKKFLQKNNLPTAEYVEVHTEADIRKAADLFGYPILLKARFDAYDGRGNALIQNEKEIKRGMKKLANRKLYVEKSVPFTKELSCIVARHINGEIAMYPVVETIHKHSICYIVIAPGRIDKIISVKVLNLAKQVMDTLKGAGVFGIEMFLLENDDVLINEIAPRVHNTGHFTIEASITSQFEQHIRAITNMPLGSTEMVVPSAVMINILGDRSGKVNVTGLDKVLAIPNVFVHIYGKMETRKQRKMGHITVIDNSVNVALKKAKNARTLITI